MEKISARFAKKIIRIFYPYGCVRRVLRGHLKGTKFVVEPSMGFTYVWGINGMNWDFLSKKIVPGMVVYDIGANRGQMSLFFSNMVGTTGLVYSFEPVPDIFKALKTNLDLNNMYNVKAVCLAFSDQDSKEKFLFSENHSTQGKLANVEPTYTVSDFKVFEADVMKLDSFISHGMPTPNILKIDVEGAAAAVFRGAKNLINKHAPSIYIELHGPEEQACIKNELSQKGYLIETLDGTKVADPTRGWHSPLWCYRP